MHGRHLGNRVAADCQRLGVVVMVMSTEIAAIKMNIAVHESWVTEII